MEDDPHAESNLSTGKRKRSPGNLVDPPIPISSPQTVGPDSPAVLEGHPLPKRPRLPSKPPVHAVEHIGTILDLPSSVLQHIFSYVDPLSLGHLVCVNQRFRCLLDQNCHLYVHKEKHDVYPVRPQDSIWSASRRRCVPNMPRPMNGLSERAQFALSFGTGCQYCGKTSPTNGTNSSDSWQAGPGPDAVRTIWPFKIRSCTECLLPRLRKVDVDPPLFLEFAL